MARTQACSPPLLLLLSWDVAGVRGVGRWCHHFGKYADSLSTQKQEGCVFWFFHPETRFQKSAFSGAAFSGSVWTVGQNDAIHMRFRKRAFSSGQPLIMCGGKQQHKLSSCKQHDIPAKHTEGQFPCDSVWNSKQVFILHWIVLQSERTHACWVGGWLTSNLRSHTLTDLYSKIQRNSSDTLKTLLNFVSWRILIDFVK